MCRDASERPSSRSAGAGAQLVLFSGMDGGGEWQPGNSDVPVWTEPVYRVSRLRRTWAYGRATADLPPPALRAGYLDDIA
jgi:hypothetical protein